MTRRGPHPSVSATSQELVDAIMSAAQSLVGLAASALIDVEDRVTLPQLRAVVLIADRGPLNLKSLAEAMNVHPSSATRLCDRLVDAGLVRRAESAADRRNLVLELTSDGLALVDSVVRQRRQAIAAVVERARVGERRALLDALQAFEPWIDQTQADHAWRLGWPDTTSI